MSRKHHTPEYRRGARLVRDQVKAQHRAGMPAVCWRGGGLIGPLTPWDVGHTTLGTLAPEHRHRAPGCCDGNRRHGGRVGAQRTGRTPARTVRNDGTVTTWPV